MSIWRKVGGWRILTALVVVIVLCTVLFFLIKQSRETTTSDRADVFSETRPEEKNPNHTTTMASVDSAHSPSYVAKVALSPNQHEPSTSALSDSIRDEVLDRVTQAFSGVPVSTVSVSTTDITDPDDVKELPSIVLVRTETGRLKMVQGAGFFVDAVGLFEPLKNQVDLTWEVTRDVVFNGRSLDLYKVSNERGSIHIWMDDDGTIPKCEQFIDGTNVASVTVEYADAADGKKQQVRSITVFPISGRTLEQLYHAKGGEE